MRVRGAQLQHTCVSTWTRKKDVTVKRWIGKEKIKKKVAETTVRNIYIYIAKIKRDQSQAERGKKNRKEGELCTSATNTTKKHNRRTQTKKKEQQNRLPRERDEYIYIISVCNREKMETEQ